MRPHHLKGPAMVAAMHHVHWPTGKWPVGPLRRLWEKRLLKKRDDRQVSSPCLRKFEFCAPEKMAPDGHFWVETGLVAYMKGLCLSLDEESVNRGSKTIAAAPRNEGRAKWLNGRASAGRSYYVRLPARLSHHLITPGKF